MKFFKGKSAKQIVAFWIGVVLLVGAIVLVVLGLIGDYGARNNPFKIANNSITNALHFPLTLTRIGVILLLVGSVIFVLSLSFMSKAKEREAEKESRRKQRLEVLKSAELVDEKETITTTAKNE